MNKPKPAVIIFVTIIIAGLLFLGWRVFIFVQNYRYDNCLSNATTSISKGEYQNAIDQLNKAKSIHPKEEEPYIKLVNCYTFYLNEAKTNGDDSKVKYYSDLIDNTFTEGIKNVVNKGRLISIRDHGGDSEWMGSTLGRPVTMKHSWD